MVLKVSCDHEVVKVTEFDSGWREKEVMSKEAEDGAERCGEEREGERRFLEPAQRVRRAAMERAAKRAGRGKLRRGRCFLTKRARQAMVESVARTANAGKSAFARERTNSVSVSNIIAFPTAQKGYQTSPRRVKGKLFQGRRMTQLNSGSKSFRDV